MSEVFTRGDAVRLIEALTPNDAQVLMARPPGDPAVVPRVRVPASTGDRALLDFLNLVEFAIAGTLLQLGLTVPVIARHLRSLRGPKGLDRVLTDELRANVLVLPATGHATVVSLTEFRQLTSAGEVPALIALSLTDLVRDLRDAIRTGKGSVRVQTARMNLKSEYRKKK